MKWIIQENLYKEEAFLDLIQALDNYDAEYQIVKVVPFSHELIPEPQVAGKVIVMGATTMIGIAQERNWSPGAYYNENFDCAVWNKNLGSEMLNFDSIICKFSEVDPPYNPFFIRPTKDRKVFSGEVIDKANFELWKRSTQEATDGYSTLTPDTMVSVAPLKAIHKEFRFFVVDGKVVTGSQYKFGDRVIHLPALKGEDAELYAQDMVDKWCPADAFVIDVALTDDGYKVIEYNCLNSAGFYKSDLSKLVQALEELET